MEISGKRFGKLTALYDTGLKQGGAAIWVCQCDCGNITRGVIADIKRGRKKSCGCLKKIASHNTGKLNATHGLSATPLYNVWRGIKKRCYDKTNRAYGYYGGRGIKMHHEWINDFAKFAEWSMKHGYSENLSIDRINNNGDYTPGNCRWVTPRVQCNNRRSNVFILHNGVSKTMAQWAKTADISYDTFFNRIHKLKWDIGRALSEPVRSHGNGVMALE